MIDESIMAQQESVNRALKSQANQLRRVTDTDYQIKIFFNQVMNEHLPTRPLSEVKQFIEKLDAQHPNAFKWLFWDENADILPITSHLILDHIDIWQAFVKMQQYHYRSLEEEGVSSMSEEQYKNKFLQNMYIVQKLMGFELKIEHLIVNYGWPFYAKWLGERAIFIF